MRTVIRIMLVSLFGVALSGCAVGAQPETRSASTPAHACLLPSYDEGYLQNPGATPHVLCVNTGKPATPQQIASQDWAPQCMDGGAVSCYHPCYAYTAGGNYPYHVVPCPTAIPARPANR